MSAALYALLLPLLLPSEIGVDKIRIGNSDSNHGDGGYVISDVGLDTIKHIFAYGVGRDVSFELDLVERTGAEAELYDHTVNGLPHEHPKLHFHKQGVGPIDSPPFATIETQIREIGISPMEMGNGGLFLKMDIEGAEYESLSTTKPEIVNAFDHIVLEIHWLQSNTQKAIDLMTLISRDHVLTHIHPNNNGGTFSANGVPVPVVMELSYVHKRLIKSITPNKTKYPTPLDRKNVACNPEISLDHPFWLPVKDV